MATPRATRVGELLVRAKLIDELQLRSALAQHDVWGGRLANVVAEMGLATEESVVDTLARALKLQRVRLGNIQKDPSALGKLDAEFAERNGVFPIQLRDQGKVLLLAMADPTDLETVDEVSRRARTRVQIYIAGEREIRAAIGRHYRGIEVQQAPQRMPQTSASVEGEEEFKLVDMSGNTVMRHISDIEPPQRDSAPPPTGRGRESAADILDDILGEGVHEQLSPEELQRLHTVRVNQEKSAKILRAVMELLVEKGYLSPDHLQRLR